ncbi:hypothetical protein [Brunnivagina elsteri]|uniref:hypothetical protein n=1 Tax=Brunnivagina elsteri TaxID=1247191 RepID=UPI0013040D53|nr:hypothetical protein [Calothrix elsteri]
MVGNGRLTDEGQEQVEWLAIAYLDQYRLFPSMLKYLLVNQVTHEVYIGDIK